MSEEDKRFTVVWAVLLVVVLIIIPLIESRNSKQLKLADQTNHIQAQAVIELRQELDEALMELKAVEDARHREQTELNDLRWRAAQEGW